MLEKAEDYLPYVQALELQPSQMSGIRSLIPQIETIPLVLPLCDQFNNATCLGDLLLCQLADPSCSDDYGDFGHSALSEDLGVA